MINEKTQNSEKVLRIKGTFGSLIYGPPITEEKEEDNYRVIVWNVKEIESETNTVYIPTSLKTVSNIDIALDYFSTYKITLREKEHPKYGKQYEVVYISPYMDLDIVGNQKTLLKKFLSDNQIEECYKVLENPLKVIQEKDVATFCKVKGVGAVRAEQIFAHFDKYSDYTELFLGLADIDLSLSMVKKMVNVYKSKDKVLKIINTNPYQLIGVVNGIGFKRADEIAFKVGIGEKSVLRIKAMIEYVLSVSTEEGNSFIYSIELTKKLFALGGGKERIFETINDENGNPSNNNINQAIQELIQEEKIVLEDNEDKCNRKVYLTSIYSIEKEIAENLIRILNAPNSFDYKDWEKKVKYTEESQGWNFTDEQKDGIRLCLENQLCLISGGAGTGKSSLVAGVLSVLSKYTFAQTALSGKASARLQEITHHEGKTIHRLLGYDGKKFSFNQNNPLSERIIILDEISMVGGEIFLSLLKAIPTGSKLLILGDLNQLESIGTLNLAHDLLISKEIPTVVLTKIHRQAQKSGIIVSACRIKDKLPICSSYDEKEEVVGELQDMIIDVSKNGSTIFNRAMKSYKENFVSDLVNEDMRKLQVLCAIKERGNTCVEKFNIALQEFVNPPSIQKKELIFSKRSTDNGVEKNVDIIFRQGDKVMCLQNNYHVLTDDEVETAIFNGWTGEIVSIDTETKTLYVLFDILNQVVSIPYSFLLKGGLNLGYASTVHKYQGSSAKVVIGVIDYTVPPQMRSKELLYTLLTRAEKKCILIGQSGAISESVSNSNISAKKTFLVNLITESYNKNKKE